MGQSANPFTAAGLVTDQGAQVFNVKAYGAKCDGSTDDTTSIQAAITAAASVSGTVFVPSGVNPCVIASFITLPGQMTLRGAGNGAASGSSLKFTGNGGGACTDAQASPVNTGFIRFSVGNVRVTGLSLLITNAGAASCLFNLQDGSETTGVEIDHDNILGSSATADTNIAIRLYSVDTIKIHHNVIKDWGQMIVGGAHTWANVLIDYNIITTGTELANAMVVTPTGVNCFSSRISGNVFEGFQSTNGISANCSNGLTISDNYLGDSSATGGNWISGNGATLIDNYIDGSGQLGSGGHALDGSFFAIGNWIYGTSLLTFGGNFSGNTFESGPSAGCFITMNQGAVVVSTGNNFTTSGGAANSYCHANSLTPHPIVISNTDTDSTTSGIQSGITIKYNGKLPGVFSTLPTCSTDSEGNILPVTDSTTATVGGIIAGSGTNHVQASCNTNGTTYAWRVLGQ